MEVPSTEVQNNFGRYLKLAWFEDIIVTKNGKETVVIKRYEAPGQKKAPIVAEQAEAYVWDKEKITYEDFVQLQESSENRYEYIDGEVYLLSSPNYDHQRIVMELSNILYNYFKGQSCRPLTAPFDVTLTRDNNKNVVQPDIVVICDTENISEKGKYTGVPALVLEVLSPSTRKKDMLKKLHLYVETGVKEYWMVSPSAKEVYVYSIEELDITEYHAYKGGDTAVSLVFAGLSVPLLQLFS
ncbi:MAG: type II toxin-antitoxin system prevent-host-death family antitoxin [Clostridia bacterium]|jgi:Uma2 family endonuclease|nr:type II toxin-antitoxin system prevent-host-death family antitoxin [Clostridia bacterium]